MRIVLAVLALLAVLAAHAGEVRKESFASPTLKRDVTYTIYIPDAPRRNGGPLPVLYVLHGAGGDDGEWVRSAGLADTLDAMIRSGWIPPYIAVLPTLGPASWWIDARAVKAETVLVRELIPHIESKYAVQATRSGRALMGASMGGFGALNLSLRYPELFCAAALFMPAVYDPEPAPASAVRNSDQFQKDGKFDFDYWRSLNYPNYLPAYAAAPRKVPMRIVVGDRDELGLDRQAADLHDRLNKLQPRDVELHFVRGAMHSWPGVVKPGLRDGLVFVSKRCASP